MLHLPPREGIGAPKTRKKGEEKESQLWSNARYLWSVPVVRPHPHFPFSVDVLVDYRRPTPVSHLAVVNVQRSSPVEHSSSIRRSSKTVGVMVVHSTQLDDTSNLVVSPAIIMSATQHSLHRRSTRSTPLRSPQPPFSRPSSTSATQGKERRSSVKVVSSTVVVPTENEHVDINKSCSTSTTTTFPQDTHRRISIDKTKALA
jgi:hypothetical protein